MSAIGDILMTQLAMKIGDAMAICRTFAKPEGGACPSKDWAEMLAKLFRQVEEAARAAAEKLETDAAGIASGGVPS